MSRQIVPVLALTVALSSAISVAASQVVLNPPLATGKGEAAASVNATTRTTNAELSQISLKTSEELTTLRKINKTLASGFAKLTDNATASNAKLDTIATKTTSINKALYPDVSYLFTKDPLDQTAWWELFNICVSTNQQGTAVLC
jgi:hypothetical protein